MTGRIAYFSRGLVPLVPEIRSLSGLEPEFALFSPGGAEAVAGWGHKPTARRARMAAKTAGLPYVAFEDGFLRSLKPGAAQAPSAMVMDRSGIYYDARGPSDLETLLETAAFSAEECARALALVDLIARHRLSKYNHGRERLEDFRLPSGQRLVLVIDQTLGDESIAGSLSDGSTFERMAEAAVRENPGAVVAARLHPETVLGRKAGYLAGAAKRLGLPVIAEPVSPWALFDLAPDVYTVSSQFGFEALLRGCKVTCFGVPFYAGWGLTDDRASVPRRTASRGRAEIAAAVYLRYSRYFDCWRRNPVEPETAVEQLAFLRRRYLANDRPVIGYRIARWKRRAVAAMLDGPKGPPRFINSLAGASAEAKAKGAAIAAWGIEAVKLRPALAQEGIACIAVEDGFLRSVGLGAAFVEPMSLVFDATGLYYDPATPSDIETMLSGMELSADDLAEARSLRQRIVAERITKYNVGGTPARLPPARAGIETVLVPGQVADDWAVRVGRPAGFPPGENVNALLLAAARRANPEARVIFKPHPDVEHLRRAGRLDDREMALADVIARDMPIETLLPQVSRIETYSSLAGFEALLRGIPVTTHGTPFYAGWGLTQDRTAAPRRTRTRSLDELVAVSLIHYPRYWDPVSGLLCPPDVVLDRIAAQRGSGGTERTLGRVAGRAVVLARRIVNRLKGTRP